MFLAILCSHLCSELVLIRLSASEVSTLRTQDPLVCFKKLWSPLFVSSASAAMIAFVYWSNIRARISFESQALFAIAITRTHRAEYEWTRSFRIVRWCGLQSFSTR